MTSRPTPTAKTAEPSIAGIVMAGFARPNSKSIGRSEQSTPAIT